VEPDPVRLDRQPLFLGKGWPGRDQLTAVEVVVTVIHASSATIHLGLQARSSNVESLPRIYTIESALRIAQMKTLLN
jgi:hypothetical protein